MSMERKKEIPEEVRVQLQRLVIQGQIMVAGAMLNTFFRRVWKIEDLLALQYVKRYFQKYFPVQLEKHRKRMAACRKETKHDSNGEIA
jgi:hypothetical protein